MHDDFITTPPRIPDAEFERHLIETVIWYDAIAMRLAREVDRAEGLAAKTRRRLIHFRATNNRDDIA